MRLFMRSYDATAATKLEALLDTCAGNVKTICQRFVGFPSAALDGAERLVILACLAHAGLLSHGADDASDEFNGALLHAGKAALKVKTAAQNEYRQRKAARSGCICVVGGRSGTFCCESGAFAWICRRGERWAVRPGVGGLRRCSDL